LRGVKRVQERVVRTANFEGYEVTALEFLKRWLV